MKMTARFPKRPETVNRLIDAGIAIDDAYALRRIAMTLHRWHELECGDGNQYASWCITRGRKNGGEFEHDDNGKPWLERHANDGRCSFEPLADRERGAIKRLGKIMAKYSPMGVYIQTDPRGAPLYILPPGVDADDYNRGIAVYR
jgi:hypothetical protein